MMVCLPNGTVREQLMSLSLEGPLHKAIHMLKDIEERFKHYTNLELENPYHREDTQLYLYGERPMTDKERDEAKARIDEAAAAQLKRDVAEFERLSKKLADKL